MALFTEKDARSWARQKVNPISTGSTALREKIPPISSPFCDSVHKCINSRRTVRGKDSRREQKGVSQDVDPELQSELDVPGERERMRGQCVPGGRQVEGMPTGVEAPSGLAGELRIHPKKG